MIVPFVPRLEAIPLNGERVALLLQAVHSLLRLKPLVDAELEYPAVAVFPSWEKSLENGDAQTQEGIFQMVADVVSDALGIEFGSFKDLPEVVDFHKDRFLEGVEKNRLLVAPGASLDLPISDMLAQYFQHIQTWRSEDWTAKFAAMPVQRQVLYLINERISPIYHAIEN